MATGDYPVRTSLCLQAVTALWVEDVAVHAEADRGAVDVMEGWGEGRKGVDCRRHEQGHWGSRARQAGA